jgi:single-strand DNA-binding protein
MNNFSGVGRWTKDIELRYTPSGKAVASCTIAIDDGFGDKRETDFLPVVMWEKLAESVSNYSGKGRLISIEGKVKTRSFDTDNGKKYVTEILARNVRFLDSAPKDGEQRQSSGYAGSSRDQQDPFIDDGKTIDLSDDDLPF